jgi:hypothetical protein
MDITNYTARQLESNRFEVQAFLSEEQIEKLRAYRYCDYNW